MRVICEFREHNGAEWLPETILCEGSSPEDAKANLERLNPMHTFELVGHSVVELNPKVIACGDEVTWLEPDGWHRGSVIGVRLKGFHVVDARDKRFIRRSEVLRVADA